MNINITGDLYISDQFKESQLIDPSVQTFFKRSDLNIVNLEAPVTESVSRILKTGPNMKADKETAAKVLEALEVDVTTLANNHILDYGAQGVMDTIAFCNERGIKTVGSGRNLAEAAKTLFLETKAGKIALVNFAENEWASATSDTAGANPMDVIDNAKQIQAAKQAADFVFVIVHGGHEYYNLPSPRMQKQYRFYADQGADIVIGHHTHCIGGYETHHCVPIYYSLGNFLFTEHSNDEDWYIGLILEVNIDNGKIATRLHPVRQQIDDFMVKLLEGKDKTDILQRIDSINTIIGDATELEKEWKNYASEKSDAYLRYWSPLSFIKNRYIRAALFKLGLRFTNKTGLALFLNLMRCEAHRDLSKEALRTYLYRLSD